MMRHFIGYVFVTLVLCARKMAEIVKQQIRRS